MGHISSSRRPLESIQIDFWVFGLRRFGLAGIQSGAEGKSTRHIIRIDGETAFPVLQPDAVLYYHCRQRYRTWFGRHSFLARDEWWE